MEERLKTMKDTLVSCVEGQLSNIAEVDTHELGEAIDMIKDLSQTMYYCSIIKAMEDSTKEEVENYIINDGRAYYSEPKSIVRRSGVNESYMYPEREVPIISMRDSREGRSPTARRTYMEFKEHHKDNASKAKELEKYMQELSDDIVEMIEGASSEERQVLEKKMASLTNKIAQLNVNA